MLLVTFACSGAWLINTWFKQTMFLFTHSIFIVFMILLFKKYKFLSQASKEAQNYLCLHEIQISIVASKTVLLVYINYAEVNSVSKHSSFLPSHWIYRGKFRLLLYQSIIITIFECVSICHAHVCVYYVYIVTLMVDICWVNKLEMHTQVDVQLIICMYTLMCLLHAG